MSIKMFKFERTVKIDKDHSSMKNALPISVKATVELISDSISKFHTNKNVYSISNAYQFNV